MNDRALLGLTNNLLQIIFVEHLVESIKEAKQSNKVKNTFTFNKSSIGKRCWGTKPLLSRL